MTTFTLYQLDKPQLWKRESETVAVEYWPCGYCHAENVEIQGYIAEAPEDGSAVGWDDLAMITREGKSLPGLLCKTCYDKCERGDVFDDPE